MLWEKIWEKTMTVDRSLPLLYPSSCRFPENCVFLECVSKKVTYPNEQEKPPSKY